jgi:type I restriction enzyme S subunit
MNGSKPKSTMSWEETTLGAEVDLLTGFPFKSERYTNSIDSIPLVRGDNIVQGAMRWEGVKRWPLSERGEHELYELREGDVVLAMDRPWIEAGLKYATISKHDLPCLLVQRTARLRGGPKLDTGYLRYLVGSREFTQHIHAITTGTAVPHISGKQIKDFAFTLPPLAEQKAIAAVLGALDDKIELNRRMNATLEAMARALFQSWFVDFDPVRAKLDGRLPGGLDQTTAALFPGSFQDSAAGHIPKGWKVGTVGDLATLNRGAVNPGNFPDETFDHFSLPAFDSSRTSKTELGSAIMSNKLVVTPNSVLLSKLNPHIPRIWLPDLNPTRRSVCSTEFMVACSKPGVSREYLFSLFTSSAFASIYGTLVTGTTGSHQRIRPESVLEMKVVIPPPQLIQSFTAVAKPLFDRINRNTEQSRTLANLRDTLLPKLLSGELSVNRLEN